MQAVRISSALLKSLCLVVLFLVLANVADAQCSICTKTAQQLGEKPAQGLNFGILYLALTPFILAGAVGYFWWKKNRS
jgi:hypothetical protein